ncbi:hypothetical protein COO03_11690 [Bacillus sp. AFS098217]|uniref:hypothetical protein n=1 Tax=unclassified Bacillus (in: firmicutes) TaxID=185979 RepID=UPI000BEC00D1|nr:MULTISPECIES: hypothetical protein [unclassified Bacillus (in: firmicutes)]PEB52444.1 hypothetical protein COO03_11690 [Bacillus sp. AFS098217]PEU16771.1 hypothetical protein CN524_03325 [Bacillus sp. AFS019443]PEU20339.1 hypothetical protein CN525_04455 [Bacillus sp. AFS014408]PFW65281.1 hypothetical protein COL20_01190 [Bacillus sp. AFS075034]
MTQFKFNFEKTYKEIDVAGKVYRVNFDDDALAKYQKELRIFEDKSKELTGKEIDYTTITDTEIDAMQVTQRELVKHVVEVFLGDGTFEELYEKAGRSVMNLMALVTYLSDIYAEETRSKTEEVQNKYLNNIKTRV